MWEANPGLSHPFAIPTFPSSTEAILTGTRSDDAGHYRTHSMFAIINIILNSDERLSIVSYCYLAFLIPDMEQLINNKALNLKYHERLFTVHQYQS